MTVLVTGQPSPVPGFRVLEARPGYYEVVRRLPGGDVVRFSASTAGKALERAAAWLAEQAARTDGGRLP